MSNRPSRIDQVINNLKSGIIEIENRKDSLTILEIDDTEKLLKRLNSILLDINKSDKECFTTIIWY